MLPMLSLWHPQEASLGTPTTVSTFATVLKLMQRTRVGAAAAIMLEYASVQQTNSGSLDVAPSCGRRASWPALPLLR